MEENKMSLEQFKECLESFVSHFNFMSTRLPKPYKIGHEVYLVQDKLFQQYVRMYYCDVEGNNKTLFFEDSRVIPIGAKFGSEDDWTEMMESVLVELMTHGAVKMVEITNDLQRK